MASKKTAQVAGVVSTDLERHLADLDAEDALETAEKRLAHLNAADTFKANDEGPYTRKMMDMLIADAKHQIWLLRSRLGLPAGVR